MAKISKVVFGNKTLIDLTQDSVTKDTLLVGSTAHGPDGELIEGACTFDVDSSEATATAAEVLANKTFAKGGKVQTGTMPNNGAVNGSISSKDEKYPIAKGFHDGSGSVELAESEKAKLIPENIRQGVTIFGISGEMSGTEDAKAETVEVTPKADQDQTILPNTGEGYNYIAQVTVKKIPYNESTNSAGGKTVTIA